MGLKIAVTSAVSWPYVRRGNRCAYELAVYLSEQGHEVHFITNKPGRISRERSDGDMKTKYHRFVLHPFLTRLKIDFTESFIPQCLGSLLKDNFDIIQTTFPTDAFAASLTRSIKGTPFVHLVYGCEPLYPDILFGKAMYDRVVKTSSSMVAISTYVNDDLRKEYGVEGRMIPLPVDLDKFTPAENKSVDPPRILCTASSITPRKRIPLLVKAFEMLRERIPDAVLQLAGPTTPEIKKRLSLSVNEKTRRAIEFLDITSDETLSPLYRSATISVLSSLKEPFGMVITESLASGTPVVGTRSGAIPDIIDNAEVGVLFEPTEDPAELCCALIRGIELARDPETPGRCRRHAVSRYSWDAIGPQYENLYKEIIDGNRNKKR